MKNILFYLQHYLSPSMTFIYRQLSGINEEFPVSVVCSQRKENTDIFPFKDLNYFPPSANQILLKKILAKIKFRSYYVNQNINPTLFKNQIDQIKSLVNNRQISLIHAHFGPSAIEVLPIARKLNIPLVVTFHGYDIHALISEKIYKKNINKLSKYAQLIVVSEEMKTQLTKALNRKMKIEVIHCGIPTDKFLYIKRNMLADKKKANDLITFLQVSNFVEKKGHMFTIQAFKDFLRTYPNARLILAGEGQLKSEIRDLCSELNISDKVVFLGNVGYSDIPELMRNADVFLHHSVTAQNGDKEGIPTAIMEAMSSGLPTISTYHSGIPELIDDRINGYLINERDVNEYTKRLQEVLNDNGEMGVNARLKIEKEFNLYLQNRKLINLYNKMILD